MSLQKRNDQMVDLFRADFQARYEPNFALANAISTMLALPGLRAFWPMSANGPIAGTQSVFDAAGYYVLTNNSNSLHGYDGLAPYVEFDGAADYLSRADGGAANWADITGAEAYIEPKQQGLTLGGWFQFDRLTTLEGLISKWGGTALVDDQYLLAFRGDVANDPLQFYCGGVAATANKTLNFSAATGTWYFCWGRYDRTSEDLTVGVDDSQDINAATGLGNLLDGPTDFNIGTYASNTTYSLDGKASLCFLCACALSDTIINNVYHQTRALFGV